MKRYLTQMAAARLGAVLVNINPAYQPQELLYCLNKVGVKAIVAAERFKTQDYYSILEQVVPELQRAVLEKVESEEAKCDLVPSQNSPIKTTWIRSEQKCSKCGQKVSSNRSSGKNAKVLVATKAVQEIEEDEEV